MMEQLNSYVKDNFGMGLNAFLKQKVEIESLYNYEIANLLDVDKNTIGQLIRQNGLKRKNGFNRRFEKNYGKGSVSKFKNMIERTHTSLTDVARFFGFSREYARQAYQNIFDRPYTETLQRKKTKKRLLHEKTNTVSKNLKRFYEFKRRLTELGFIPRVFTENGQSKILVNGYKVAFRFSQKPRMVSKRKQFHITYQKKSGNRGFDFLVCLCKYNNEHVYYVIPDYAVPKHGLCLIPQVSESESKYACFKEAWNLIYWPNVDISGDDNNTLQVKSKNAEVYPFWQINSAWEGLESAPGF